MEPTQSQALVKAQEVEAQWESELVAAREELAALQRDAGDLVLDDPDAAVRVPRQIQVLRDRVETASSAVGRARVRRVAAERAARLAEAEALQPEVDRAVEALRVFDARADEIMEQWLEHTRVVLVPQVYQIGDTYPTPARHWLEEALGKVQRQQAALIAAAGGLDPLALDPLRATPVLAASELPASLWGPDAEVPLPQYVDAVARAEDAVAQVVPLLEEAEEVLASFEARHPEEASEEARRACRVSDYERNKITYVDRRTVTQREHCALLVAREQRQGQVDAQRERLAGLTAPKSVPA